MTDSTPTYSPVDLKWENLIDFAKLANSVRINHPALKSVFDSFHWNVVRTSEMILALSQVGYLGQRMQYCLDRSLLEVTGNLDEGQDFPEQVRTLAGQKLQDELQKDWKDFQLGAHLFWRSSFDDLIHNGTLCVTALTTAAGARTVSAILASCVISSWTTFETLASDLWETALNVHPNGLSDLKGKRKKRKDTRRQRGASDRYDDDDEPRQRSENRGEGKSVPLTQLQRHRYDLSNHMGSVLRVQQKFDSLAGIREAYVRAFHKSFDRIDLIIEDRSIDALHAVRNVRVHRSGIVDEKYERDTKSLNAPKAGLGQRIFLDGEITFNLIAPPTLAAADLIAAVDTWITAEK